MPSFRSSRRVTGLKDSDYDHEINLVNHEDRVASPSLETPNDVTRASTGSRLLRDEDQEEEEHNLSNGTDRDVDRNGNDEVASSRNASSRGPSRLSQARERRKIPVLTAQTTAGTGAPSIEVEGMPPRRSLLDCIKN